MSSFSKKIVSASLSFSTAVWMSGAMMLVPVAQAQSTTDLAAQVASLMATIQQLQAQLNAAKGGGGTSVTTQFTRDLTVGSKGAEVTALQQVLIDKGYLKIESPTGYFGALTKKALAAWQADAGVTPSVGYFGPKSRAALNAMLSAETPPTTGGGGGTTTPPLTTGGGTTAPATGLAVSLASDNPGAGALISSANSAAARVPVLTVNLTAGTASGVTVSELKFKKQGVLADSSISGAYLIEGGKVLTQYTSLNSGVLSFSGLNLSVAAGQTRKLTLAIDPATGLSAGNTVSFSLLGASDITAVDAANAAVTTAGTFPLNGSTFTVTTVTSPAVATLIISSSSVGTAVYAGTQNILVSQWQITGGNSAVNLNSINFKVVGSANKSDIKNVKLFINGTQVGQTLAQVSPSGEAFFDLTSGSSSAALVKTGTSNMQIYADVMGSPSFSFQFELLNTYDVYAVDTQYNTPITPTINGGSGVAITINQGSLTVSAASDTPTGNITVGGASTPLAKFTIYAAGEPVKVKFLNFQLAFTGGTGNTLDSYVKNVNLADDAGGQIGSTINSLATTATCTNDLNATGFSAATTTAHNCFGSNTSPINYIIPANTTRVLTLRGDIQSGADFTTLVASLPGEATANLQGLTSSQTNASGPAAGGSLSLVSSNVTTARNSAVGTITVAKGAAAARIGSYTLTASTAEGVNLNSIGITMSASSSNFSNLKVMLGSTQFGTTFPGTLSASPYTFSGTLNIPAGQTKVVDVFADVLSNTSANTYTSVTTLGSCSGSGATTFTSVSCTSRTGQNVTAAGQGTVQVSLDSGSAGAAQLVMGSTGNNLATFRFTETSSTEDVKITDVYVFDRVAGTSTVNSSFGNLSLCNGTNCGTPGSITTYSSTSNPGAGYYWKFSFANPLIVPKSGSISAVLKGDVASYSDNAATDNATHTFRIATTTDFATTQAAVVALGRTSNASSVVTLSSPVANTMTVLRSKLNVAASLIGTASSRTRGTNDDIAMLKFSADTAGDVVVNTVTLRLSGAAASTTLPDSVQLIDDTTGATWGSATIVATTTNSVVTFSLTNAVVSNGGKNVRVRVNSNNTNNTSQQTDSLSVSFTNVNDVQYTTAVSGGTSGVGLPTTFVPFTIVNISYE